MSIKKTVDKGKSNSKPYKHNANQKSHKKRIHIMYIKFKKKKTVFRDVSTSN